MVASQLQGSIFGTSSPVLAIRQQRHSMGAAADLDQALELLMQAKNGTIGPTVRLYRPEPTVAFGQRDAKLPGFEAAAKACRRLGFEPLVRKAGGRAAAYHRGTLVVDHVEPATDAIAEVKTRFGMFGELLAGALQDAGVTAAVGEIPGEYCPGEFSVHGVHPENADHRVKLIGTAQRVVAGAWLFSSVIVVEGSGPIREVLTESYAALGLNWDPSTAGAAEDLMPGVTVDRVEQAVLDAYAAHARLEFVQPSASPSR